MYYNNRKSKYIHVDKCQISIIAASRSNVMLVVLLKA